jgi:hypothetical protein
MRRWRDSKNMQAIFLSTRHQEQRHARTQRRRSKRLNQASRYSRQHVANDSKDAFRLHVMRLHA